MKKIVFLLLIFSTTYSNIFAQNDSIKTSKQLDFLFFLLENKQIDDFNFYGEKILNDTLTSSISLKDSVAILLGGVNERLKDYKKASQYYDRVSDSSAFYYKARFTSAILDIEKKKYESAKSKVSEFNEIDDVLIHELTIFELSGLALLKKDYNGYDSLTKDFNPSTGIISTEYQQLTLNHDLLLNSKRKSPFVAASLSALVPGLGKVYAGKTGQGIAAFLKVVPLGIIAFENYNKHGYKDAQFIFYSSLFGLFYIGNIWGSAFSVKVAYIDRTNAINYNISVGLRIPVDKLF